MFDKRQYGGNEKWRNPIEKDEKDWGSVYMWHNT